MAPLATTDPTAQILLDTTAIGFALSEISIRVRSAMNRGGSNLDHGSIVAVVLGVAAGVLVAVGCAGVCHRCVQGDRRAGRGRPGAVPVGPPSVVRRSAAHPARPGGGTGEL